MKLVTLLENTACVPGLAWEHGLSLYLETGEHKILFDMGQSGAFADNARKLGIDLSQVELAVLSHGHYDHGGGLARFLEINGSAKIYVNRHGFEPHYNAKGKDIGLSPDLQKNSRLCFTDGETVLAPGLTLHTLALPPADSAGLTVWEEGQLRQEDFRHEQYLMIQEAGKRILISGCSHKGIVNIVKHFQPDILVGGFHLMKVENQAFLRKTAEALMACPTVYHTGHCTGEPQFAFLKTLMGDRLQKISAGSVLEF